MKLSKLFVVSVLPMILSGLIIGCASIANASNATSDETTTVNGNLNGTSWTLHQLQGKDILHGSTTTLIFADDQVHGNATCNRFFGPYENDGERLSFGPLATTMMACENMNQETNYLAALASVTTYRLENGQLVLANADQGAILVFEPTQHISLKGTTWQLDSFNNGTALVSVLQSAQITATFSDDQMTGSAGCNRYFASFTTDGHRLSIGPVGSTEMFCAQPEGIMEQEQAYLKALESVDTFQIEGNVFTLFDANGKHALEFTAVENGS